MLDEIRTALAGESNLGKEEFYGMKAFYGNAPKQIEEWNYFVFNRKQLVRRGAGGNDFSEYYRVAIVMENYIPEGMPFAVIKAVTSETNLRLADSTFTYDYTYKGGTDLVVEVLQLEFVRPLKGCDI